MTSNTTQWHEATVLDSHLIADRIREITFSTKPGQRFQPGDHINISIKTDVLHDIRSYSVVRADESTVTVAVLKTRNSRGGSEYMHRLSQGDRARISTRINDFPLRIGAPHYVLVAGGIGITAITGMASLLQSLGASYEFHYSARSEEAAAYLPPLRALHKKALVFHDASSNDFLNVSELVGSIESQTELYMCGPIRLMEDLRREWKRHDLDPTNLRFETFGNSGWFTPELFSVVIPQHNLTVDVGPDTSILEAVQAAGVRIVNDCRRGECGLCQVKILDTNGSVDHRDVFYSEKQKAQNSKLCSCVSRISSGTDGSTHPTISIQVP